MNISFKFNKFSKIIHHWIGFNSSAERISEFDYKIGKNLDQKCRKIDYLGVVFVFWPCWQFKFLLINLF